LGGPVSGGQPYLVGERGPELFVPSVSGGIVPNNSVGSFMSGGRMNGGNGSTTLRGQDIILAYARTQRSQLRVNG
jgi:phage-related minor tail protein